MKANLKRAWRLFNRLNGKLWDFYSKRVYFPMLIFLVLIYTLSGGALLAAVFSFFLAWEIRGRMEAYDKKNKEDSL